MSPRNPKEDKSVKIRMLALLLSAALMVSMLPLAASAAESDTESSTTVTSVTEENLTTAEDCQEEFEAAQEADAMTWDILWSGVGSYSVVKDVTSISGVEDASDRIEALKDYYEGITQLSLAGKTVPAQNTDQYKGLLAELTGLKTLDLSDTGIDATFFGGLVNLSLTSLDLSGNEELTDLGGLLLTTGSSQTSTTVAQSLETLDISNTGVTNLNFLWNSSTSAASVPNLTSLTAKGLALTSVAGLVQVAEADDFDEEAATVDLSGSTLTDTEENRGHLQRLEAALGDTAGLPSVGYVVEDTANGTVTVSPNAPAQGGTVTITAVPAEGYKVGTVTVTDEDGEAVTVAEGENDNEYTYTQPDGTVTIAVTFVWDNPFADVDDEWYTQAVQYVYQNNIMAGMDTTPETFAPEKSLSRAEAVQLFYNLEGQPDISDENLGYPYGDVEVNEWYTNAIYWARLTGVAVGDDEGNFRPNATISRQEFAQMLYNYAKYKKYDLTGSADLSGFSDAGSISSWAETAMEWANANGLINGHADTLLIDPTGDTSRAQAASIMRNFDLNVAE